MPSHRVTRACPQCGELFNRRFEARFCSQKCCGEAHASPIEVRLFSHVEKTDTCWVWTGKSSRRGYAEISVRLGSGQHVYEMVHRVSWRLHYGPIPDGLLVCHHCDNRLCIRPDHLFLGTYLDNSRDMVAKNRQAFGERQGGSKLTESDVRAVRARYSDGGITQATIALEYGVSEALIAQITQRKIWTHVA